MLNAQCKQNVPFLPSGSRAPKGILLEELDLHIDIIYHALQQFDEDSAFVLDGAASLHCSKDEEIDVMPREEVFLVSSFLLNVRQATYDTSTLRYCTMLTFRQCPLDRNDEAITISYRKAQ